MPRTKKKGPCGRMHNAIVRCKQKLASTMQVSKDDASRDKWLVVDIPLDAEGSTNFLAQASRSTVTKCSNLHACFREKHGENVVALRSVPDFHVSGGHANHRKNVSIRLFLHSLVTVVFLIAIIRMDMALLQNGVAITASQTYDDGASGRMRQLSSQSKPKHYANNTDSLERLKHLRQEKDSLTQKEESLTHSIQKIERQLCMDHQLKYCAWNWNRISVIFAILSGSVVISCFGFCCWVNINGLTSNDSGLRREGIQCSALAVFGADYAPIGIDAIGVVLRREMMVTLLYPLLPLLAARQTSCKDGPPLWLYGIFAPFLMRSKLVEWRILSSRGKAKASMLCSTAFIFGILDTIDWISDGIFPVQAATCDDIATIPFAVSVSQSGISAFTPTVAHLHFWGLAYIALAFSTITQHANARAGWGPVESSVAMAADVCGFGLVANCFAESEYESVTAKGFVLFARVVCENCLQLAIQSSFFCLVFNTTSKLAKIKLLFSIGLSALGALFKVASTMWLAQKTGNLLRNAPAAVACTLMVVWSITKVYFAYACKSHLWNLTTFSCVDL